MKESKLVIRARYRPEILERVLRVIRHRQFEIEKIYMYRKENNENNVSIKILVNSNRKISLLYNQLIKLIDIFDIEIL